MTDDYTPTGEDVREVWLDRLGTQDPLFLDEAEDEFDRWIAAHDAQVKRDAAWAALNGLARNCEQIAENAMTEAARNRWDHTAHVIRETLAVEYAETEDQT